MKHRMMMVALVAAMSLGLVFAGASTVLAKASGVCSNCHTMHDSQGGADLGDAGVQDKLLLKGTCLGCHTGENGADTKNIPYVMTAKADVDYGTNSEEGTGTEGGANTLAGGNFTWVENGVTANAYNAQDDDVFGHNVADLTVNAADGSFATNPPGFSANAAFQTNGAIGNAWGGANKLTCAGTYGCHGEHNTTNAFTAVAGGHHGDDSSLDGLTVAKSYRFLKGIRGVEDSDWELTVTAADHNVYHGVARAATGLASADSSTISYLCAECHGDYHSGVATVATGSGVGTPWLRHPTDFDLSDATGTDYAGYSAYSPIAPVATDVVGGNAAYSSGAFDGTDAVVTCISCHRAHGTPYPDLLRWDPVTAEADNGDSGGCLICHTGK